MHVWWWLVTGDECDYEKFANKALQGIDGWGRSWKSPRGFVLSRLCKKRSWQRKLKQELTCLLMRGEGRRREGLDEGRMRGLQGLQHSQTQRSRFEQFIEKHREIKKAATAIGRLSKIFLRNPVEMGRGGTLQICKHFSQEKSFRRFVTRKMALKNLSRGRRF